MIARSREAPRRDPVGEDEVDRMTRDRLLVFDVGLTHVKSILFDAHGSIVDSSTIGYPTDRPRADRVEQDPEAWWGALRSTTRDVLDRNPGARSAIAGIGVTGHMHALVCVGGDGGAIGPALVLGDRRAERQAVALSDEIGAAEVYRMTGTLMDASMPAAKIRWLRDNEVSRWRATEMFLGCKDFIRHRLIGDLATESIDACATSLFDINRGSWSDVILEHVGTDAVHLPEVRRPEEVAGTLGTRPAAELSLLAGTPVVIGAGDDIEVLGNGLLEDGGCLEHMGTTGSILAVSDRRVTDPAMSLEVYPHAVEGLWVIGGSMTAAGAAIAWATGALGFPDVPAADEVLRGGDPRGRTVPIFSPHLLGERVPRRVPGAQGAWIGIDPGTTRDDLMRAVFEGVAFGLRAILDRVDAVAAPAARITVSEAREARPDWLRLRASAYGRPLASLRTSEPTALGVMILLATAIGAYPDVRTATAAASGIAAEVPPDPDLSDGLRRRYARYLEVADALGPTWPEAAEA
jgi:xylulokinase